jgi:hypothetical protein
MTPNLAWGAKVSPEFRAKVRRIADNLGCDPSWLMACMAFETGETFSPSVKNPNSSATGLIQFMTGENSWAVSHGYTRESLSAMTAEEQLDVVAEYFAPHKGRILTLSDCYMAILYPAAVSWSGDAVIFGAGSKAYLANKGLDLDHNNAISKDEAASFVKAKLEKGMKYATEDRDARPDVPIGTPQPAIPPTESPRMGALIPFLASILPVVFKKFEPRAEAVVAQALGGDKATAAQFLADFAGKLGTAVGIPITDQASAVQAVAAVNDPVTVKALQEQALDYLDRLADVMQKASALDAVKWTAEVSGKDAAADRAIKERKAGAWDMTPYLVGFAGAGTTLCSVTLLGAIVWQSVAKTIDPVLLGLAGPLLAITFAAWKAIFDYRFDGTKESSDQSKALVAAATKGQ